MYEELEMTRLGGQSPDIGEAKDYSNNYKELLSLQTFYKMNAQLSDHESIIKDDHQVKIKHLSSVVENQEEIIKELKRNAEDQDKVIEGLKRYN
jgi:hypothetical protein